MNKYARVFLLVLVFLLGLPTTALAQPDLQAGCPVGFHPHNIMDQDDHAGSMHQHAGTAADQNGDGVICAKHTSTTVHVHVDNAIPVQ